MDGRALVAGDLVAGKYEVRAEIGRGGMAIVYEAVHTGLGTVVALKVLRSDLADSKTGVGRFAREARSAARLQSEHVARVLDVGTLDGSDEPFIVMERLQGRDLRAELRARGPLPPGLAADWLLQACEGVAEAHARGIVHRDLKPSNLFLARRDDGSARIKVLDFGIAKALTEPRDVSLTGTQEVFGSPQYMSPEQLRATSDVSGQSDVWALGVVLYELLDGHPPLSGRTIPEVHAAVLTASIPPLKRDDLPEGLREVVGRCLQKDPARRFGSVGDLARALRPFASPSADRNVHAIEGWAGTPSNPGHMTMPFADATSPEDTRYTGSAPVAPHTPPTAPPDPVQLTNTNWDQEPDRRRVQRSRRVGAAVVVAVAVAGLGLMAMLFREDKPAVTAPALGRLTKPMIEAAAQAAEPDPPPAAPSSSAAVSPAASAATAPTRAHSPVRRGSSKPTRSTYDVRE